MSPFDAPRPDPRPGLDPSLLPADQGPAELQIRQFLALRTQTRPQDWYLVLRARLGMEAIFRCFAGRPILTQAFTCVTAINPILAAGAHPVYGDISPENYSLAPASLHAACTGTTPTNATQPQNLAAVVLQHTFGIIDPQQSAEILALSHQRGMAVVEDCAHCAGRMFRGEDQARADFAVHSFGAEKMLPTAFGGAIWVNPDSPFHEVWGLRVRRELAQAAPASGRVALAANTYRFQNRVFNHLPGALSGVLRRAGLRLGTFLPPIIAGESQGRQATPVLGLTSGVARQVEASLQSLSRLETQSQTASALYFRKLSGLEGVRTVPQWAATQPLVRFPLQIGEGLDGGELTEAVFARLNQRRLWPGRWYRPALFPGVEDPQLYGLPVDMAAALPQTHRLIGSALQLRTLVYGSRGEETATALREIMASL